jgi:hypothetical protein
MMTPPPPWTTHGTSRAAFSLFQDAASEREDSWENQTRRNGLASVFSDLSPFLRFFVVDFHSFWASLTASWSSPVKIVWKNHLEFRLQAVSRDY